MDPRHVVQVNCQLVSQQNCLFSSNFGVTVALWVQQSRTPSSCARLPPAKQAAHMSWLRTSLLSVVQQAHPLFPHDSKHFVWVPSQPSST